MCRDNYHNLFFLYLLVLYINSSVTCLKFAPKLPFFYFQPILAAFFVTIATVKVESMPDFYTLAIVLIKLYKETYEEQLLYFYLIGGGGVGGQNSLLMHNLPHNLIKDKLIDLVERTFQREGSPYFACNDRNAFFTSEKPKKISCMVVSKCM